MPATKPIVGSNAFAHESGIHIAAILEDPATYEYVPPALLGLERHFILGKHTGKRALIHILGSFGYQLPDEQVLQVLEEIKERSEGKCSITQDVLRAIIQEVTGEEIINGNTGRDDSRCLGRRV
jgi:methanogen homocitrate synthase